DADLTDATVLGQEIGWVKPKGALAHVSGRAVIQGERALRVEDIAFAAGDLGIEAGVAFDPATGAVSRVSVRRLQGAGHDLAAEFAFGAQADDIRIYGRAADLRPLLAPGDEATEQDAAAETPPHPSRIRVDLDKARLTEGLTLARFRADMTISGDWPSAFTAEGDYPGGALRIAPDPERRGGFVATASEFGRLLEGLGVTEIVRGGGLTIQTAPPTEAGVALDARAGDFDVDKADLARIVGEGSTDLLSVFDGGDRINFDRLLAKAVYKEGVIQIEAAQAGGAGLGVSAEGVVDLAQRTIDVRGAIAPAYGFSRVIGGIPILGDLLAGSKKEGVFAATYRATGDLDDPAVEVNGLSALAPGIIREALEGAPPGEPKRNGEKADPSDQYDYDRNSD
ncbi:MAG: AsmA-like C-terminal domain-containing protein, partial [Alphaproteobacteria bacterium]